MAVAFVTEFPIQGDDRTTTNYDAINERLTSEEAPEGLILHYAGFDEETGVFRAVTIWETQAQGETYRDEKVMPTVRAVMGEDMGIPPSRQGSYELHHVAKP
ncbi:MAG: hypothetical protein H0U46_08135 [Actinobacteria bacterium]|nr:hypothetical protein [Actinomycetota bacterium]MBA3585428.1 hypothetical protein [Gemmatimonadota bacterium]